MSGLRFDDRVAIVTGAGNGLGRQHALLLGSLGAKVVVNDLGSGAHGEGKSSAAADQVVEEIREAGGEAVANYDSVEEGHAIVKTALDAFGTVDIVINNAGILRDTSFAKMTDEDWDLILKVHLTGSKSVTQAAWPILREKGYGRIIMTTSAAGLYGNFGQANYCAAKLGLLGLAQCLAEEGRSKGIHVNTIAPIAASRLTETVMPAQLLKNLKPEKVSPLVAWLCHENCSETKGVFEVGAGYVAKLRWERTRGYTFPLTKTITVDDIASRWEKITDFTGAEHPGSTHDSVAPILSNISNPRLGGNEFIDLDEASQGELVLESDYDERDVALYALGIGAAQDPMDKDELKFVYELGSDFCVLPTFAVMPQSSAMLAAAKTGQFKLPGMNFGLDRLLHGEQYTEIRRPLPAKAKLKHIFKFKEAFDKDPHAVVTFSVSSVDEQGNEVAYNEMTSFVKGAGGWGGDRGPSGEINLPPEREPDAVIEERTDANQTLLYRLSGDWNPLHADPAFAKAFGYDKPILHGLCTFGYCGRHVIKAFCNNDPRYFKSIKVRFAKNVFPGETLVTRMWKESDTRIVFETRVKERDEVVIKNAAVELFAELPEDKAEPDTAPSVEKKADDQITLEDIFSAISEYIATKPGMAAEVKTGFQFRFHNPDSQWFIDLKNGEGSAGAGEMVRPDVTIELDAEQVPTLFGGNMDEVQKLYFSGKMKISGNVMASNKLSILSGMDPALVEEARRKRLGSVKPSAPQPEKAQDDEITLGDIFSGINSYIATKPDLVEKVSTCFQFRFTDPDTLWFIDLKHAPGRSGSGETAKPDVTIELPTRHVETLFGGDLAAVQKLFFSGEMKVSGNVMASNKLSVLSGMERKWVEEARNKRLQGGSSQTSQASAVAKPQPHAPEIFSALQTHLERNPDLFAGAEQVQFNIEHPNDSWVAQRQPQGWIVEQGVASAPAAVFTLSDQSLEALAKGERSAKDLFQHGLLKVEGDMGLAHQLECIKGLA